MKLLHKKTEMMKKLIGLILAAAIGIASPAAILSAPRSGATPEQSVEKRDKELEKAQKKAEKEREKAEKEAEKARKKAEKEREKAEKARQDSIAFEMAKAAVEDSHFVIVADRIRGKHGYSANVNESTNFVLVQGETAIIQFALERGFGGPNGLGGITVEGRISNKSVTYDKRGNLIYSMYVTGTAVSADVRFTLPKGGISCDVTVSANYSNGRITFSGDLKPYDADLFQGRTFR